MTDESLYYWAQWGVLNAEQYHYTISHFGDLKTAWHKITPVFLQSLGFGAKKAERIFAIREKIDWDYFFKTIDRYAIQIFCLDDPEYPEPLKAINNPPPFLFVRGSFPLFRKALAVVGTRKMTPYGERITRRFVQTLARHGLIIISGLAMGIDACAHQTALQEKGITVAVLGSGVDVIFPQHHQSLAEEMLAKNGAIVSEYPLGTPALKHHFPLRNRIISGLCRGVVVIEGGIDSGALITARYALEQGRDVFAVPHPADASLLSGANALIRKGEAKLIEKPENILEEYSLTSLPGQVRSEAAPLHFSDTEKTILHTLGPEGKNIDTLAITTPFNVAKLADILIQLQLKGIVREVGQKWIIL